jgi:hypothetical protein
MHTNAADHVPSRTRSASAALLVEAFEHLDQPGVVDELEQLTRSRLRFVPLEGAEDAVALEMRGDGCDPLGSFGMPVGHLVRERGRMRDETDAHGSMVRRRSASAASRLENRRYVT